MSRARSQFSARRLDRLLARRSGNWIRSCRPPACDRTQLISILRPIVQRLGIEIRTIWPLHRSECCVEFDTVERVEILKGSEYLAFQYGSKIESLVASVL